MHGTSLTIRYLPYLPRCPRYLLTGRPRGLVSGGYHTTCCTSPKVMHEPHLLSRISKLNVRRVWYNIVDESDDAMVVLVIVYEGPRKSSPTHPAAFPVSLVGFYFRTSNFASQNLPVIRSMKHALTTLSMPRSLSGTTTLAVAHSCQVTQLVTRAIVSSTIHGGLAVRKTVYVSELKHHRQYVIRESPESVKFLVVTVISGDINTVPVSKKNPTRLLIRRASFAILRTTASSFSVCLCL